MAAGADPNHKVPGKDSAQAVNGKQNNTFSTFHFDSELEYKQSVKIDDAYISTAEEMKLKNSSPNVGGDTASQSQTADDAKEKPPKGGGQDL